MYLPFLRKNYWFQLRWISMALSYMVTSLKTLLCWKLVCSFLLAPTMSVGFIINILILYWVCLALIFRSAWLLKQLILKDCLPQRDLSLKWLYFIFQTQDLQCWCWNEELHSFRKLEIAERIVGSILSSRVLNICVQWLLYRNIPEPCSEYLKLLYAALYYYGIVSVIRVWILYAMIPLAVSPCYTLKISQSWHSLCG